MEVHDPLYNIEITYYKIQGKKQRQHIYQSLKKLDALLEPTKRLKLIVGQTH